MVALPTSAFPSPLPKQQKSVFDHSTPSLPTEPYAPLALPTPSQGASSIGYSEILYGTNEEDEPNVVEDMKRPWWRPAKRPAITKPRPQPTEHKVGRRERVRLRPSADKKASVIEEEKVES